MKKLMIGMMGAAAVLPLFAKIEMGTPFADQAVLQRGMKVPVWGKATAGNEVTVEFAGQKLTATADADGKWRVDFAPMEASKEGRAMSVKECERGWFGSAVDELEIKDVLVGEVWFASGQSNMECPIWSANTRYRDGNGALVVEMSNLPFVRWCKNVRTWSVDRRDIVAKWYKMTAADFRGKNFSAVAFYYARELYIALDIPIGIVDSSWGGTNIDAWTPRCGYSDCDRSIKGTADYKVKDAKEWNNKTDRKGPISGAIQQPTVLFNGMVASWAPMAIRGFIWYQGCHNSAAGERDLYCAKLHALYNGWSREFENRNLKFYLVQLAPCSQNWQGIVNCQNRFVKEQKNSAIAVISDAGNFDDIHPNRKEVVAKRLAVHALKRDYGFDIPEDDSPVFKSAKFVNGTAELTFDHVKRFYVYADNRSHDAPFEVAGADGVWQSAKIVNFVPGKNNKGEPIDTDFVKMGNVIVIKSDKVAAPVKARYMVKPRTESTVYNEVSLPLGLFETK